MPRVNILDRKITVSFLTGKGAVRSLDKDELLRGAEEMAALIERIDWPERYRGTFRGMKKIVFFEGSVKVNGYWMDRPCCDEDDAVFYWKAEEFMRNTDADVRANTFFHDCWHVVQFKESGNRFARGQDEQVEREVDATGHQIEVAKLLGCEPREISHLERFMSDNAIIVARLKEGVGLPMHHTA